MDVTKRAQARQRFCGWLTTADEQLHTIDDSAFGVPAKRLGCVLFFSGFLSDTQDLKRQLGLPSDLDDFTLLVQAYQRWGELLHVHVLGEYSLCLYEPRTRTLLITQDALGLGGVFYRIQAGGVQFANHLIDLLDIAGDRSIDRGYVAQFLACGGAASERTPFSSITRLLPGQSLLRSAAGIRVRRTWTLASVPEMRLRNDGEYQECFRELLCSAVRASVNPDGVTWIALSGGLDSSSIASVAGKLCLDRVGSYTFVSPSSPRNDEQSWARSVIDAYPMPWHRIDAAQAFPFAELPSAGSFQGEPTSAVIQTRGNRLLNELMESHNVRTVLTGHGGDAVLGSSPGQTPSHLVDLLFSGRPLEAWRALSDWSRDHYEPRSRAFLLWRAVLDPAVSHLRGRRFGHSNTLPIPPWISPEYSRVWMLRTLSNRRAAPADWYPGRQEISDSVWSLAVAGNAAPLIGTHDVRRPLLYRPFFEFMYAVPGAQRFQPKYDRALQRRALKGILPELVRRRGTKVFGTWAIVEGLARSPAWIDYLCDDPQLPSLGVTTAALWRDAMVQASVGNTFGDRFFIAGVAMEVWLKQLSEYRPARRRSVAVATTPASDQPDQRAVL
jgi:asparagine synthase (glutamine-hydrolysing)